MKKDSLFFFKLVPAQLLSALIRIPEDQRGTWITKVALELADEKPEDPFSLALYEEAGQCRDEKREQARLAGLLSAEKRKKTKEIEQKERIQLEALRLFAIEHKPTEVNDRSTPVEFS